MNSISMGTQSSVSLEETNQPSPAGWMSTPLLLFLGKQEGSRFSKKRGVAEEAIGMPVARIIATPANAISGGRRAFRSPA
jgi:hypothetical protein